jgi:hypothetical protein
MAKSLATLYASAYGLWFPGRGFKVLGSVQQQVSISASRASEELAHAGFTNYNASSFYYATNLSEKRPKESSVSARLCPIFWIARLLTYEMKCNHRSAP